LTWCACIMGTDCQTRTRFPYIPFSAQRVDFRELCSPVAEMESMMPSCLQRRQDAVESLGLLTTQRQNERHT